MRYKDISKWFDSKIILEGGKVFKTNSSISKELIPETLTNFYNEVLKPLNIKNSEWCTIGSTLKKNISNDIDIAVVKPINEIEAFLRNYNFEYRNLKGLDILSLSFPITKTDKTVQIDLIPTDNLTYCSWSYHSPYEDESNYSATYRNALLESIASEIDKKILSTFDNGDIKKLQKKYFSYSKGLMEKIDSFVGKRGKQVKKHNTLERKCISKDPKYISEYLLGEGTTREHTNSFESIFTRMMSAEFPYKEKIVDIKEKCISILKRKKLDIPPELISSKKETFKEHNMLENVVKMPKIPHIDQMSIKQIKEFFTGDLFEFSEKMDGANFSIGVVSGKVYGKSKKDKANFDADYYYSNKNINDIFIGMGNLLQHLEQNNFLQWYNNILKNTPYTKIQIFGEVFYSNQVNAITYGSDRLGGKGGYVVFGIYGDGQDISNSELGNKIMIKFTREFNTYTFPIWFKNIVECKLEEDKIKRLLSYIKTNHDVLTGLKRDPEFKERKMTARSNMKKLLNSIKSNLISQSEDVKSILGGDDNIEGLVMKNTKNNRMVKIVDVSRFGELNAKNWANRNELKKQRQELFKELTDRVCNNCDIITLPSKREESLRSYLAIAHKTKFDNVTEMLAVLVSDMQEEVDLKYSVEHMKSILTQYIENLSDMKLNIDKTLDKKHFSDTTNMYDKEISEIKSFIENISKQSTPQIDMVRFMLGPKTFKTLKAKYLN